MVSRGRHSRWLAWAALLGASSLFATAAVSPAPFQVEPVKEVVDGIPSSWIDLTGPDVSLRWFAAEEWAPARAGAGGVSGEFFDPRLPSLRAQLRYYPSGVWLGDLGEAAIKTYLETLAAEFPESTLEVLNPESLRPPEGGIPFLGGNYRQIFFEVTPDAAPATPVSYAEALAITDSGGLLVLRFTGPTEAMTYIRANFGSELGRFIER